MMNVEISKENREKLNKIMKEIVEKYKDKPLLYRKLNNTLKAFGRCRFVNPEIYKELANLTKMINFRCYIENGKCKAGRTSEMCCCTNCEHYFGHLHTVFFNVWDNKKYIEEEMLYYAKKFNIKTGFWRKDKGCILPRHKRSATCLTYNCTGKLTFEENLLLAILRNVENSEEAFPSYMRSVIQMLKNYFLYRDE